MYIFCTYLFMFIFIPPGTHVCMYVCMYVYVRIRIIHTHTHRITWTPVVCLVSPSAVLGLLAAVVLYGD